MTRRRGTALWLAVVGVALGTSCIHKRAAHLVPVRVEEHGLLDDGAAGLVHGAVARELDLECALEVGVFLVVAASPVAAA